MLVYGTSFPKPLQTWATALSQIQQQALDGEAADGKTLGRALVLRWSYPDYACS